MPELVQAWLFFAYLFLLIGIEIYYNWLTFSKIPQKAGL